MLEILCLSLALNILLLLLLVWSLDQKKKVQIKLDAWVRVHSSAAEFQDLQRYVEMKMVQGKRFRKNNCTLCGRTFYGKTGACHICKAHPPLNTEDL